jgi:hypothetical protein
MTKRQQALQILKESYQTSKGVAEAVAQAEENITRQFENEARDTEFDDDAAVEVPEVFDRHRLETDFDQLNYLATIRQFIKLLKLEDYEALIIEKFIDRFFGSRLRSTSTKTLLLGSEEQRHRSHLKKAAQSE